jgi:tripartite-type tricarboxylate transporter receptor subunit TctC
MSETVNLGAPKSTPAEIVDKLNEINAGLADPKIKARLADFGGTVLPGSPADCGKLIADEIEKWGKVIRTESSMGTASPMRYERRRRARGVSLPHLL